MSNKVDSLQEALFDRLIEDLDDPLKCTPGLYQVVRGVINDNKKDLDSIPNGVMEELQEKLSESVPFKFGGS
tara:strand:+ start:71 stop:286 length:216 start_codon:yes stop_codon:yes gene_type:complete